MYVYICIYIHIYTHTHFITPGRTCFTSTSFFVASLPVTPVSDIEI